MIFIHERAEISTSGFDCLLNALHTMHVRSARLEEVVFS